MVQGFYHWSCRSRVYPSTFIKKSSITEVFLYRFFTVAPSKSFCEISLQNIKRRRRRDIKILFCLSAFRFRSEKFNTVGNNHGRTQKCDFCISVCKTNFKDHHTPYNIHGFRDLVLVCKMHVCYSTIGKNAEHFDFHSFPSTSSDARSDYMKTNHFKMLLNVFGTTYTYSNCIVHRLFYCRKTT